MPENTPSREPSDPERRQPLPSLLKLPGHLLRQLPQRTRRLVVAGLLVLGVGMAVAGAILIPQWRDSDAEAEEREEAAKRERREERIRQLLREQRVMRARGAPEDTDAAEPQRLRDRRALKRAVAVSIEVDARARYESGEFRRDTLEVRCFPFPANDTRYDAAKDLSAPTGRYECLAVTSEIPSVEGDRGGYIGQPFRTLVNFETGEYAWCKISGVAGERALSLPLPVGVPRECGGQGQPAAG